MKVWIGIGISIVVATTILYGLFRLIPHLPSSAVNEKPNDKQQDEVESKPMERALAVIFGIILVQGPLIELIT